MTDISQNVPGKKRKGPKLPTDGKVACDGDGCGNGRCRSGSYKLWRGLDEDQVGSDEESIDSSFVFA